MPALSTTLLPHKAPAYPFVARDYDVEEEYSKGFSIADLMPMNGVGMVTAHDDFVIGNASELLEKFLSFQHSKQEADSLHADFEVAKKTGWDITRAHAAIQDVVNIESLIRPIHYRPFDTRSIIYLDAAIWRPVRRIMDHLMKGPNLHFMSPKQTKEASGALIGEYAAAHKSFSAYDITSLFPLYLYPEEGSLDQNIRVNFDPKLFAQIRKAAGLTGPLVAPDGTDAFRRATGDSRPDEVKVFDYIYGVLHSPAYRATYAEFLKIDFPRIPFPASPENFRAISAAGETLRRLHLMEDAAIGDAPCPFHGDGESVVDKPRFDAGPEGGRVWINASQYFENVPAIAWDFPIGGYQPAQKWLKDRKGRALSWDDIRHYQKIIKILAETDRIMHEIELPLDSDSEPE